MDNLQLERIQQMEERFDAATQKLLALQRAADEIESFLPEWKRLTDYYDSGLWRKDYLDDENGKLPVKLKRGVLSEDGISNLFADLVGLQEQLQDIFKVM